MSKSTVAAILLGVLGLAAPLLPVWKPSPNEPGPVLEVDAGLTELPAWSDFSSLFEISRLPAPSEVPPQQQEEQKAPDLTAQLQQWRLDGIVLADSQKIASFYRGEERVLLQEGGVLAQSRLTSIEDTHVVFQTGTESVTITLAR